MSRLQVPLTIQTYRISQAPSLMCSSKEKQWEVVGSSLGSAEPASFTHKLCGLAKSLNISGFSLYPLKTRRADKLVFLLLSELNSLLLCKLRGRPHLRTVHSQEHTLRQRLKERSYGMNKIDFKVDYFPKLLLCDL